jgi:Flp pilus assembly protein TadG
VIGRLLREDRGSTLPLIIGFFVLAMLMVAGSVAAGDAFVQQRGLQDVCDGAALAGAASAVDLDRGAGVASGGTLRFADVQQVVDDYLARDPGRADVQVDVVLSADARTLSLTCVETRRITFGSLFGQGDGVRHVVHAAARAPTS